MFTYSNARRLLFLTFYLVCVIYYASGSTFFWEPDELTWVECRNLCKGLHGDIVSLHTKEEYNDAISFVKSKRPINMVWIGLSLPEDKDTEKDFRWVDGSSLLWASWDDGDPNHMKNKKCVSIDMDGNQKYDTERCDEKYYCLCEGTNGNTNQRHQVWHFEKITGVASDTRVPFTVLSKRSRLECASYCMRIESCHVFAYADDVCSLFTPNPDRVRLCLTGNCDTYVQKVYWKK